MPNLLGQVLGDGSTLSRLARFFRPDADPWDCLPIEVAPRVFGHACSRTFAEYLQGPSRVAVRTLDELCAWLRGCETVDDSTLFFAADYWQHPVTFEQLRRGDCEDHALWAWRHLQRLGISARFVAGLWRNTAHTWLIVRHADVELILEATAKTGPMLVPIAGARADYCPGLAVDHALQTYVYQGYQRLHAVTGGNPPAPRFPVPPVSARPAPAPDFEVAILAGGRSSRMGRDKARLRVDGRSLLAHTRAAAAALGHPVRVIRRDARPACGPLGGVFTALRRAKAGIVLFLSCDMPAVTPTLLRRVIDRFGARTRAVFTWHEARAGFPFALRRDALPAVEDLLRRRRLALQELAGELAARPLRIARRDAWQLANLNTPEDLAVYRERSHPAPAPEPPPAPPPRRRPRSFLHLALVWLALTVGAGVLTAAVPAPAPAPVAPPADRWLPAETMAGITIPSVSFARMEAVRHGPGALWADAAMKPLRRRFEEQLARKFLEPLEGLTGLPAGELVGLAEGQLTLALLDSPARTAAGAPLDGLLLIDTGSRSGELTARLAAARARAATNPAIAAATLTVRQTEFLRLRLPGASVDRILDQAFPRPDGGAARPVTNPPPIELIAGADGPWFIAATTTNVIDGVLARLHGAAPVLTNLPAFNTASTRGSNTLLFAWLDAAATLGRLTNAPAPTPAPGATARTGPSADRLVSALGLKQVQTASFTVNSDPEGWFTEFRLAIPTRARRGLFRVFQPVPADAAPPLWVPDDILSFARLRLSGPAAWSALQKLLLDVDPAVLGVVQLVTEYAGRTEDVDFNFDRGLIAQLGDDWMAVSRKVESTNVWGADLIVHGSTHAAAVHHALTLIASPAYLVTFLPPGAPAPERHERTVAGHRVVSVGLPPLPWQDNAPRSLHLAMRDDLVGMAGTATTIDTFLTVTNAPAPLIRAPAFARSLARAGGAEGGWTAYNHERESARHAFDLLTRSRSPLDDVLKWAAVSEGTTRIASAVLSWIDFDLLPPFERVARHFQHRAESGRTTPEGFLLTTFRPSPAPPAPPVPPPIPPPVPPTAPK